jgi:uncharacterized membrane protein YccC
MRMVNTLIGIAAGLAVSHFVLPVSGRDLLEKNMASALAAVGDLLAALAQGDKAPGRERYFAVFDAMVAMEKTLVDARNEIGVDFDALREPARQVALACLGALSAASGAHRARAAPGCAPRRPASAATGRRARATREGASADPSNAERRRHAAPRG